jgi:cAMP-dependent protein kinase regulator
MPLFKSLPDYEILLVADALKESAAEAGSVIVKEGDAGENFYVLIEGECVVRKGDGAGGELEVARLAPGAYFGEVALLRNCPRTASVVAVRASKFISLDGKGFHRLLGPCIPVLEENMRKY